MNQRLLVLKYWGETQEADETPAVSETRAMRADARDVPAAEDAQRQKKAAAFFRLVAERRDLHWEELQSLFRDEYYDAFDLIIPPLLATDDPLIVYNCLRFADFSNPKEADVFKQFVLTCDIEKHQATLLQIGQQADVHTPLGEIWQAFSNRALSSDSGPIPPEVNHLLWRG